MPINDVERGEVEIFDISEDGSIAVELAKDHFTLEDGQSVVDLEVPYALVGCSVVQENNRIEFENQIQMDYFTKVVKEREDEDSKAR